MSSAGIEHLLKRPREVVLLLPGERDRDDPAGDSGEETGDPMALMKLWSWIRLSSFTRDPAWLFPSEKLVKCR